MHANETIKRDEGHFDEEFALALAGSLIFASSPSRKNAETEEQKNANAFRRRIIVNGLARNS